MYELYVLLFNSYITEWNSLSLESGHMQSSGDDGLIIMSFQPSLQEMLIAMGEKIRKCFLLSQSD